MHQFHHEKVSASSRPPLLEGIICLKDSGTARSDQFKLDLRIMYGDKLVKKDVARQNQEKGYSTLVRSELSFSDETVK